MRIAALMFLATAALAQAGNYDQLISEANKLQREHRPGEPPDVAYHRAYQKLFEAFQLDPSRHEAPALRVLNRCEIAALMRRMLAHRLNEMLAGGASPEAVLAKENGGIDWINIRIGEARHDFNVMGVRLKRLRRKQPEMILFTQAAIKWASAQYVAEKGRSGAIEDFKSLVQRRWRVRHCSEFIALSYLQQGAVLYVRKDFEQAQAAWSEGLQWAQDASTKRSLLINMAGGLDSAGQYLAAKKLLRELIDREPTRPGNWKNLGLLLGNGGELKRALHAYGKSRELCEKAKTSFFLGLLHGSAWLKSAMIHGKLLSSDGDMLVAWNLFVEYRQMFGDDYNFCVNFGDFAFHTGQSLRETDDGQMSSVLYELAQVYLERARKLHPFCRNTHLLLLQLAPRLKGTSEEATKRIKEAMEAVDRLHGQNPGPHLAQLCGGLIDRSDPGSVAGQSERIKPDPLKGFDEGQPPPWILAVAESRDPFKPYEPAPDGAGVRGSGDADDLPHETGAQGGFSAAWIVSFGVLAFALALVFWLRSK